MYRIEFNCSDEEEKFSFNSVHEYSEQPPWHNLADAFLGFLKANGYVFDYDAQLVASSTVGDDIVDADELFKDESPKPAKKGKKKK
jgi:hypothetical protein